jgi:protein gp37
MVNMAGEKPLICAAASADPCAVVTRTATGPGARPVHQDWVRGLLDQCYAAGVPFFFKQWGEWSAFNSYYTDPSHWVNRDTGEVATEEIALKGGVWQGVDRVGKKAAGHLIDGVEYRQVPEVLKPYFESKQA